MLKYTPHFLPSAIYLVGCGGTGSRLVPMMTQLVRTVLREFNPAGWMTELPIFLIDDDVVEEKNLLRQNFISQDVGKSKAVVLAERYQRAMGIPIHPIVKRLNSYDSITSIADNAVSYSKCPPANNIILIMAVDSPQARREILHVFFKTRANDVFVIDAGNEDNFGQVKFFTNTVISFRSPHMISDNEYAARIRDIKAAMPKMTPEPMPVNYIPYSPSYYDNLGTTVAERSCADLDQTLAINALMATIMCGVLQNFLYIKPFMYNQINYSLNGAVSTVFNSGANWFSQENFAKVNFRNDNVVSKYATYSIRPQEYTSDYETSSTYNEFVRYLEFNKETLGRMGLDLCMKTGEVTPKKAPVIEDIPVARSPKKRQKKVEAVVMEHNEDIDF